MKKNILLTAIAASIMLFGCGKTTDPPVDKEKVPATDITLNQDAVTLTVGETVKLTASVEPSNSTDKVTWSTSDTAIATVANGTVTAVGEGSATITAKAGDFEATCEVTVEPAETLPAKVGDYYYSDGTWSTSLNESKTAIGIIFAVHWNRAVDESNYWDRDDFDPDYVNLVVSLDEIGPAAWCVDSTLYPISGMHWSLWNGLQVLEEPMIIDELPNFPIFEAAENYATAEGQDWYIPAVYELRELIRIFNSQTTDDFTKTESNPAAQAAFNAKITAAGGTPFATTTVTVDNDLLNADTNFVVSRGNFYYSASGSNSFWPAVEWASWAQGLFTDFTYNSSYFVTFAEQWAEAPARVILAFYE